MALPVEIVIKSHPLADMHEAYDEIERNFPSVVKHWREPFGIKEGVQADVVVFYNCVSTLFFSIADQQVPVLAHWGALNPLGHRVLAISELMGSDDSTRLGELIREVFSAPDGIVAREAQTRARALFERFVEPSAGNLEQAVEFAFQQEGNTGRACEYKASVMPSTLPSNDGVPRSRQW